MTDYQTRILEISGIPQPTLDAMCNLYLNYYDGCDKARFINDLASKNEALLIYNHHELVGFTLYALYRETWQDSTLRIIYSGDTIVEHTHWGQQALAFSWISRAGQLKRLEPNTPLYWFLIVKGHRTYRYLPTFSHTFHPHWSKPSQKLKPLADWLAKRKFGKDYDPNSGIIAFHRSQGHLKHGYALPTPREASKDAVKFFLQRNPGYIRGHEMVCLCELCNENLKPLAQRLFAGNH
jgi:hypothetical protein